MAVSSFTLDPIGRRQADRWTRAPVDVGTSAPITMLAEALLGPCVADTLLDMGRPTDKQELLAAAEGEFDRLWDAVDLVGIDERERPGACEAWSVKDLLAHLDAWHEMVLTWEAVGSAGETPEMPAPGLTWAQTPVLNQQLFEQTEHDLWDEVVERVRASHEKVMAVIESYSDEELFTKKRFKWTGSTSVGSYLVSASASHYAWASKLIRKWARTASSRKRD